MPEDIPTGAPPAVFRRRRTLVVAASLVILAAAALTTGALAGRASTAPTGTPTSVAAVVPAPAPAPAPRPVPSASPQPAVVPSFNRAAYSIDDPTSPWVVVNKRRPLAPVDHVPPDLVPVPVPYVWQPELRREAADAVVALFAAFQQETGLELQSQSAYRSYSTQAGVYDDDVAANGQPFADTSTARPGFSEHQTGLAIDFSSLPATCTLVACFGDTPHGQWLAANAWRFGFLLRYPADKVAITGFHYEPWHFRYIGVDLATEMRETGSTTLEEFFGLPAAPAYE